MFSSYVLSSGLFILGTESMTCSGRESAKLCYGIRRSRCLMWMLTSQALVHMHWQEDANFPKQQCIHACRGIACTHSSHIATGSTGD
jgi:hypothetical protein